MITITINTENEAFAYPNMGAELARILRKLANTAEETGDLRSRPIIDSNGNIVGDCDEE